MQSREQVTTLFFDLGATLVDAVIGPDGKFSGFTLLPDTASGLKRLADAKLRLGIISNTGDIDVALIRASLAEHNLLAFFEPTLVLFSGEVQLDKRTPAIFRLAVARDRELGMPCLCRYVGEDATERRNARRAGMRTSRSLEAALETVGPEVPTGVPDFSNLPACIEDARNAGLDGNAGPPEPHDYNQLLGRLEAAKMSLPPIYRQGVAEPFIAVLRSIGPHGFSQILQRDPRRESTAGLLFDIAQTILQNGEGFEPVPTDGFEEVVSDLYDGFLSAEDRSGLKLPDNRVLAPLVKWGNPDFGPYTWPIDATSSFHCTAAVVNLPPANARRGLFAWAALGHETAGHDILHADDGLQDEISRQLRAAILAAGLGGGLADYWSQRIDETASDVMGILNMGPAAGIGLVVYFRGLNAAFTGNPTLRNEGSSDDPHPADILRGFLAAATVRLLSFGGAVSWADAIERETEKDLRQIRIAGVPISVDRAKRSCEVVANVIAAHPMRALNDHSLIDIQNWRNTDEAIMRELQQSLVTNIPINASREAGIYAAHVVAAAAVAALEGKITIANIFQRMIAVLKKMHDANPSWGPLFVAHPGSIFRDFTYVRSSG
jgi:hypothetical protein